MSSRTRRLAGTRDGIEHLWTARPQSDVRAVRTGLLKPNSASVCYWHDMAVAMTWQLPWQWPHLLVSDLNVTRTGGDTCFVLQTCGWKPVPSKQCTIKLKVLYNCCVPLFKFARMFNVELYGVLLGWRTAEVWCFGDTFCRPHQVIISHLCLCIGGGTGNLCDVTFASHSPFSYCLGWSGFKRSWHPNCTHLL